MGAVYFKAMGRALGPAHLTGVDRCLSQPVSIDTVLPVDQWKQAQNKLLGSKGKNEPVAPPGYTHICCIHVFISSPICKNIMIVIPSQ